MRSNSRGSGMELKEFIKSGPPIKPVMPLVHIMDSCDFDTLMAQSHPSLLPRTCKVFNENLLYFFYGKAAYRANSGKGMFANANAPIVIITNSTQCAPFKRVLPFDSGAFHGKRFSSKINSSISLDQYLLECNLESAQNVIGSFYHSNDDYFRGRFKRGIDIPRKAHGVTAYYRLISEESADYDDRCSSIELQIEHQIPLDKDKLLGLILPATYRSESEIDSLIMMTNAQVRYYDLYFQTKVDEYMISLRGHLRDIFSVLGVLL